MGAWIPSGSGEYCKSCFSLFIRPGTKEGVSLESLGVNWGRRRGQGLELGHNMKKMCMRYAPGQVSSNLSKVFLQISKEYFIKLVKEKFSNMKKM